MRIRLSVFALSMVCISFFPACRQHNKQDLKISVEESAASYIFSASFPDEKTAKVHRVINSSMSPNGLFASVNDYLDVNTTLQDKTHFAVKASPGSIRIQVDREGNSPASYTRVKEMCASVKEALKD